MTVSLRSASIRLALILIGIVATAALGVSMRRWKYPQARRAAVSESREQRFGSSAGERLAALDNSLRAIEDGDRAAPRDRWDPASVVRNTGTDPTRIFAWVRDSTRWIPYHGVLRGAVGVLMDRRGNSLDRALLLATMLETAGHHVRLAHAELPRETARAVIPGLVVPSPAVPGAASSLDTAAPPQLRTIAARYNLDPSGIGKATAPEDSAAARFHSELEQRVSDQTDRLMKQVTPVAAHLDWHARYERALGALQDHWWVQRQEGDRWIDLDPLQPEGDSLPARPVPAQTLAPGEVPLGERHLLTVRVIAERWNRGTLSEHRMLEHVLQPADLYGEPVTLQFWPAEWPAQLQSDPDARFGLRTVSMAQREWGIALLVGRKATAQAVLRIDGTLRDPPTAGGFGALGAGIGAITSGPVDSAPSSGGSELTAAWIEYEFQTPGDTARVVRRAVFDLLGPAARSAGPPAQLSLDGPQRLRRSLALMIRTELLPVTAAMPSEYVTHLTAQAVLASAPLLRLMAASDSLNPPDPDSLLTKAAPALTPLYTLAVARFEWSPVNDRIYVDRLNLLTQHRHPAAASNGFQIRGAVDVAAGTVGVSLGEPDGYAVRLRQGVLDTNAEALWWQGITVLNAGEAYATGDPWVTLAPTPEADAGGLQLPADAKARIAQDLAAGFVVVAPAAPVAAGPDQFVGWWRIDARTGEARGIAGNGWGQCQPDYAVLVLETAARGLWSGLFEYGLCHGLWQGINAVKAGAAELQARGVWLGSTPIRFRSAAAVYGENRTQCLISAIGAGVIATLPIILKIRQLQKLKAIEARMAARPRLPADRLPRFLEEAQAAHKRAGKASKDAAKKFFKLSEEDPAAAAEAYKEMMARSKEEILAKRDLNAAMEEYQELARAEDRALADLNAEYASELLQLGFGGLLGM